MRLSVIPEINKEYDIYLDNIARNLSITKTMYDKAVSAYTSVGNWLDTGLSDYKVSIFTQGSFNLGTTIKPISDNDDYDIDLVCLVENKDKIHSAKLLKASIGHQLEMNKTYKEKLSPEGKRCWTLEYEEFHMDILPAMPKNENFDKEKNGDIIITHTDDFQNYRFQESNPFEFKKCFINRSQIRKLEEVQFQRSMEAVDPVPKYLDTTVLQECIKLLKRHRDLMFKKDDEDAPISMIITTLAGLAYDGSQSISIALEVILNKMDSFIQKDSNGNYRIENPVNQNENFADKWNKKIIKAKNFYKWLDKARKDFILDSKKVTGLDDLCSLLSDSLGKDLVKKSFSDVADIRRHLRENKSLYVRKDLMSNFAFEKSNDNMQIKEHVFFGK